MTIQVPGIGSLGLVGTGVGLGGNVVGTGVVFCVVVVGDVVVGFSVVVLLGGGEGLEVVVIGVVVEGSVVGLVVVLDVGGVRVVVDVAFVGGGFGGTAVVLIFGTGTGILPSTFFSITTNRLHRKMRNKVIIISKIFLSP